MKKLMIRAILIMSAFLLLPSLSFGGNDCECIPKKVHAGRAGSREAYVFVECEANDKYPVHIYSLGHYSDPMIKARLSLALTAITSRKKLNIYYWSAKCVDAHEQKLEELITPTMVSIIE